MKKIALAALDAHSYWIGLCEDGGSTREAKAEAKAEWLALEAQLPEGWDDTEESIFEMGFSANQAAFIKAAKSAGYAVISYSGRGMMGEECPAIIHEGKFPLKKGIGYHSDTMGMYRTVYYARD